MSETSSGITKIATDLEFPEGPVWCSDGGIYIVEIRRQTVTHISSDGDKSILAKCGGGPNGIAVGPDGYLYVCNNGGFDWDTKDNLVAPDYVTGSIQKIDPATGSFETLYDQCDGRPLCGPNDIVFDSSGGFWFTDFGKTRERTRDRSGVYYAKPDGSEIAELIFPVEGGANGVGLSPDESRLYVAETFTGRLIYFDLEGPGRIRANRLSLNGGHYLASAQDGMYFDSLAVDSAGNICVGTIGTNGGITVISPDGRSQSLVETNDFVTTNICFGGEQLKTAYITCSYSGELIAMDWDVAGLALQYNL